MTFAQAIDNQLTVTENGMVARVATANAVIDLFYGATRGVGIVPKFVAAYVQDSELTLRVVQWIRDARGGSGERQLVRDILLHMEQYYPQDAMRLMTKLPELGRWDDLLVVMTPELKQVAYTMISDALKSGNGLCAKWMPRQGPLALELRVFMGLSPKAYRKMLVGLTKVVESQMCAKDWDNINFSHVPSVAHARYKKAFGRNTAKYSEYVQSLIKGEDGVKISASAVYPYDVLKGHITPIDTWMRESEVSADEIAVIEAQWAALPDFIGDASVLPLVDVSGSMTCKVGGRNSKSELSCMDVAVSLGLYFADKNSGVFKDCFLTFSAQPELLRLKGTITEKIAQMTRSDWGMNTNLNAAMELILRTAVNAGVGQSEMPGTLVILSDMNFDQSVSVSESAMQMIARQYEEAGYQVPRIVFWNLNHSGHAPAKFDESGVALVSGFSPAIASAVLSGDSEQFTPEFVMRKAVMIPRYDI
jgi:hypothetical protein